MYSMSRIASLTLKNPDVAVMQAKRVLRYLAGTAGYGLLYRSHHNAPSEITVHSDASWAPQGEKSHGGTVARVAGTAISWKSGRQSITAMSTAESELVQQVVGFTLGQANKATLDSISDGPGYTLVLKGDNQAANCLANDSAGSWRTRRLMIRANALREACSAVEGCEVGVRKECGHDSRLSDQTFVSAIHTETARVIGNV